MKVQLSIDDDLMNKADEYAKKNYLTRSGLVSMVLSQFLEYKDISSTLGSMLDIMNDLNSSVSMDDEGKEKLKELEGVYKVMSQKVIQ